MKVSVDIDCTPEEARRFMGLPDMAPVHDVYLDRMKTTMAQGITPESIQGIVKGWAPMGEAGMMLWRQLMDQMAAAANKKP